MADPKLNLQRNLQPKSDQGIVQFPRRAASARRQDSDIEYDQEVQEFVEEQEERADIVRSRQVAQQADKKPDVKYRIGLVTGFGLVLLSIFSDVLEIILFFSTGVGGTIKDFVATYLYPLIFWVIGVPFWKGKKSKEKILTMLVTLGIGYVPFVSDFTPELTIGVILTILLTRAEDIYESKKAAITKMKSSITRIKRTRDKIRRQSSE